MEHLLARWMLVVVLRVNVCGPSAPHAAAAIDDSFQLFPDECYISLRAFHIRSQTRVALSSPDHVFQSFYWALWEFSHPPISLPAQAPA